ncbi:MAG: hypothetical protein R3F08_11000 [Dokdonella sp.]
MLANRATDHFALCSQRIHITVGLTRLQEHFSTRVTQLHELFALGRVDLADAKIGIDRTLGKLLQVVTIGYEEFLSLHTAGGGHIQFDSLWH